MVITILKWVGIAMVLSLIALWLWEGGYWKVAKLAEIIPNPLEATSTDARYQLPGQPDFFEVPDTTSAADEMEYGGSDYQNPRDALYDSGGYGGSGERSPYAGFVDLQIGAADNPDKNMEYVVLRASNGVSLPITVSGWTLRSAYSGNRAVVPLAASPFYQGVVNSVQPIALRAGDSVVMSSGVSPLGVSFRESTCTGYLAQTQHFSPSLSNACLRPTDLMPYTPENAARYGADCLDFVERLPQCSYPTEIPAGLSSTCKTYLTNTFTYNGCVRAYGTSESTHMGTWRAYSSASTELWRNSHESIVLTDAAGRVVTTLTY